MELLAFLILFVFVGAAADVVHCLDDKDIEALTNHKYGPPAETEKPFSLMTEELPNSNSDRGNGLIKFNTIEN